MKYTVFAAIEIGAREISMKVYEVSEKKGVQAIDFVRRVHEMGNESYKKKHISQSSIDAICDILNDLKRTMKEYKVEDYVVCSTSAIRDVDNYILVLERIYQATGLVVKILSNQEKRFLFYKGLYKDYELLSKIGQDETIIVDVGAGSVQISLYEDGTVKSTQNIQNGFMRVKEAISEYNDNLHKFYSVIAEYISYDLKNYREIYLKEKTIKNIVAVGDNIIDLCRLCNKNRKNYITRNEYEAFYEELLYYTADKLKDKYNISKEKASLMIPIAMIYKKMFKVSKAEKIWFPNVMLHDGIALNYSEKMAGLQLPHDFEKDIIMEAINIAKRYNGDMRHIDNICKFALEIFDEISVLHGLDDRARLLLEVSSILHSCGSYISVSMEPINSYNIIMSTEIIGMSVKERELVANIVKYMSYNLPGYNDFAENNKLDYSDYLMVAKLSVILKLAEILDRSHRNKIKNIKTELKDKSLVIYTDTMEDITLEKSLLNRKSSFFADVYGVVPKIKRKK